ncbi:glycine betaine/L-proline ABC transporter ATP-binding protein [Photobacterium sp. 2_MG-2023]|uniref:quaternary amine ABC transporter ATP-binding protein n=1 Tax=Photobacterium sp. 2_MG-2023 TaxID=3062663 RepID=UPI0026E163C5|nr:glycine betaine/L-proline ABC transporter ATP-binding protein [Photobacterium sp. 2_MG-2023]MDO6580037.1 glycine betaine/L-proline ABC transporter ATP-binding protein [Photobacterium sp. 2_MG-2023]
MTDSIHTQDTGTTPLIRVRDLYKVFGPQSERVLKQVHAGKSKSAILAETGHTVGLNKINLSICQGEIFVVMGLSGSGKSTLIRHFNRLIEPSAGQVEIDGVDVTALSASALQAFRRQRMAMVFQRFALLPHRTVLQNIGYGLQIQGVDNSEWREKASYWLETVGLAGYGEHYPSSLSGGQQQRVGLARALCTDADILLMDEAFSALDPLIRSEMQEQLMALQSKLGKTIIFITHDLDEALRLGDRIAILRDGELIQQGRPVDILLHPIDDYVEAFVKDVNRSRVLKVEAVMSPGAHCVGLCSVSEANRYMEQHSLNEVYVLNEQQRYLGVLTRHSIEKAMTDDPDGQLEESALLPVPAISRHQLLEQVLPVTLEADVALPVLGEQGEVCGRLSRSTLAKVLSEHHVLNATS